MTTSTTCAMTSRLASARQCRRTGSARYRGSGAHGAADNAARRSRDVKAVCREGRADRCFFRQLCGKMDGSRCHANPRAQRLGVRAIQSNLRLVVQGQKCTCQIESRAVLRCVRRGPSQVSTGDLDTYIGRSGRAKSLLSELIWLCGTVRPPSASYRDRGSSSDVRNVFQRDGTPQPIARK